MKHKIIITSIAIFLVGLERLHAQESPAAAGGEATGTGGTASYSVGQVVYSTSSGTNGSVAQGVQQPYEISATTGVGLTDINLELIAFPNPTNNNLTLNIGNYNNERLIYQLYDMQGKLLENKQVSNISTVIDMQELPVSIYLLNVLEDNTLIKAFKIIKN